MNWRISEDATANAATLLPGEVEAFFRMGREVIKKRASSKTLHRFRLATKRFRYSLEMFRPIYGRSLDRRLKALRGLQDSLGKISDSQTLLDMLPGDPSLRRELDQSLKKHAKQFRKEWKKFDGPGCLSDWKLYLSTVQQAPAEATETKRGQPSSR